MRLCVILKKFYALLDLSTLLTRKTILGFVFPVVHISLMQPQGILVSEVFFASLAGQQRLKIFMNNPDVVSQGIWVFEPDSAIVALEPGVIVFPSVFQKRFLVFEHFQTFVALQPDSFVPDVFVAVQVSNL